MHTILTPTNAGKALPVLAFDNLDDRREIMLLLARLNPPKRLAFVRWFCSQARLGPWGLIPRVQAKTEKTAREAMTDSGADERLTLELYLDLWRVGADYEISLDVAFRKLVEVVRH